MSAADAVIVRHLRAVAEGDPDAMAADYADDAVLERGGERYEGRAAIRAYFGTVPDRLAGGRIVFEQVRVDGEEVVFRWRIAGGPADDARGTDTCTVRDGAIVNQVVRLATRDF